MPTRDDLFEATDRSGIPRSDSTPVIDSLCEAFGGEHVWIPPLPDTAGRVHRDGKIYALWLSGLKTAALSERFELSARQVRRILQRFSTMN